MLIHVLVLLCSEVMDLLADKFTGTPRPQPTKFAIKAKIYVIAAGKLINSVHASLIRLTNTMTGRRCGYSLI